MKYINPEIESSYYKNNIGLTLYNIVLEYKPKIIIEFGSLYGYSTISMAMALDELKNNGIIKCYDLWDKYQYKHTLISQTKENINKYNLSQYVEFHQCDFNEWKIEEFDMFHLDISNSGETIINAYYKLQEPIKQGKVVLFEGGSIERDNVSWMKKYNKIPINSLNNYKIINNNFPSLSMFIK